MSVHSCSFGELEVDVYDPSKYLERVPPLRLSVSLVVTQQQQLFPAPPAGDTSLADVTAHMSGSGAA